MLVLQLAHIHHGYCWRTWLVVCNYAFVGLATSAVIKYADNIVKTFASASAMFVVALFSIWMGVQIVTPQLFIGILIAAIAMEQYSIPPRTS